MNYRIIIFLLITVISAFSFGQRKTILKTQEQVEVFETIPKEYVHITTNSQLYFAGEYIYYNVFNLTNKNTISELSKVAYVALVDEHNNTIYKKKLFLENGKAQGDYFIPASISTGTYKVVGFTQWMLNAEEENLFIGDVNILNPYKVGIKNDITLGTDDSMKVETQNNIDPNKNEIKINTDKDSYPKRSLVSLNFDENEIKKFRGTYSLSVRKKEVLDSIVKTKTRNIFSPTASILNVKRKIGDSIYLPEIKGALYYGKIKSKYESESVSLVNQKISVSIIGGSHDNIIIVETDKKGEFSFNINQTQFSGSFIFQLLENDSQYDIIIDDFPKIPKMNYENTEFVINEKYKTEIINRSVLNQIENDYYNIKPDTILVKENNKCDFYGNKLSTYKLDDYTRFTAFDETATEILFGVVVKKTDNKRVVDIKKLNKIEGNNLYEPLVLVDGFHVTNHEDIISYNSNNIKSISFLRETYYLGNSIYDGIISIETFDKVYLKNSVLFKSTFDNSNIFQKKKNYFKQNYTNENLDNIPDFRSQLLWEPNFDLEQSVTFYTSDNVGEYVIVLEGITDKGEFSHSEQTFVVK